MSGPKVDYAKLREQEMASLAEARGRRLKVADKIQKMINQIDSCLGGDVDLMLQDLQIGPSCKKIQELQAQYKKELQALYNTVKHGTELLDVDAILHGGEVLLLTILLLYYICMNKENILTKMCKFNKIINHKGTLMET